MRKNSYAEAEATDSKRWWWPFVGAGATAVAAIVAITVVSAGATASDPTAPGPRACPSSPDPEYVGVPWVPAAPTGCPGVDRWWTRVNR